MKEKSFKKMNFLTSSEIAQKLKMNTQVILRKLQSGEIEGYKLGKDWRVEEGKLLEWLEKSSSRRKKDQRTKILESFFAGGKLKSIPAQRKKKIFVLEEILKSFEPGKVYSESDVNKIISSFHPDFCTIRREFIINKMMQRRGGKYKVASSYRPFLESLYVPHGFSKETEKKRVKKPT